MSEAQAQTKPAAERVYGESAAVRDFARKVIMANGVSEGDAATCAHCLVQADLRGVDTHGVVRLPGYLDRIRRGLINAKPDLKLDQPTPVAAALDGQNGLGFVIGTFAMRSACDMAETYGIGMVAARRSTHFGMAATYLLQALERGFIGFVFTNASRAMPPWGGRSGFLGTSPFSVGVPSGKEVPFVLDMSPAVAARGKIRRALRRGESIPLDYALDADGKPTSDPAKALEGVVLPIGGPKGSGISMLMDIMGGVFSGAAFAGDVGDQYKDYDRPQNVGHFFLAIKPGVFVGADEFRDRMDVLVQRVHGNPRAEGFDEILMPGEIEARLEAQRLREGIPYARSDLTELLAEAERVHVAPPHFAEAPK